MAPIVEMAEARWHGGHMRHIPVSTAALMLMLSSGCGDDDAVPDAALDSAIDVASEGGSTDISEDVSGDTEVAIDGGEDGGLADAGVDVEMPLPIVCTEVVADQCELDDALPELAAGDTLCLADGSWPDLHIDFVGEGTMYEPITIAAEHAGMATASGSVSIRIGGSDVVVHGLVIDGATPDGEHLIDFRAGSDGTTCSRCRLSECAVLNALGDDNKWVSLRVRASRVEATTTSTVSRVAS